MLQAGSLERRDRRRAPRRGGDRPHARGQHLSEARSVLSPGPPAAPASSGLSPRPGHLSTPPRTRSADMLPGRYPFVGRRRRETNPQPSGPPGHQPGGSPCSVPAAQSSDSITASAVTPRAVRSTRKTVCLGLGLGCIPIRRGPPGERHGRRHRSARDGRQLRGPRWFRGHQHRPLADQRRPWGLPRNVGDAASAPRRPTERSTGPPTQLTPPRSRPQPTSPTPSASLPARRPRPRRRPSPPISAVRRSRPASTSTTPRLR